MAIERVQYRVKIERQRLEVVFDLKNDTATVSDNEGRAVSYPSQYQSAGEAERFAGRFISETKQEDATPCVHRGEAVRQELPKPRRVRLLFE